MAFVGLPAGGEDPEALVERLRHEHGLALVPGSPRWFGPGGAGHVRLCFATGEGILAEVEEKLTGKLRVPAAIAREYLKLLRSSAEIMKPAQVERGACRDPEDLMVLGLIEAGRAEVLVSGDKDLLVLRKFAGARVLSPRGFWEEVGKKRGGKG